MAPFAERDGDIANAWMEGLGNVVVPREPLLPLSHSVNSKLTTLCPRLDAWLRGGVPTRSVTEIAGEAGSAKTQLALQLLIAAQLPREMGGLDGTAVYVHTEGRAPLSRLKQLVASHPAVRAFVEAKKKTKTERRPDFDLDLIMRGVYVAETLDDPDGLWTALVSVASVLRGETGDDGRANEKETRAFARGGFGVEPVSRSGRVALERRVFPRARPGARRRAAARVRAQARHRGGGHEPRRGRVRKQ
jgi:DNA-repair protein XRCC3